MLASKHLSYRSATHAFRLKHSQENPDHRAHQFRITRRADQRVQQYQLHESHGHSVHHAFEPDFRPGDNGVFGFLEYSGSRRTHGPDRSAYQLLGGLIGPMAKTASLLLGIFLTLVSAP